MTHCLPRSGHRARQPRFKERVHTVAIGLSVALTAAGCATSTDYLSESTPDARIAAHSHDPCPSDYFLVCEVDSPFRLGNNRFGTRKNSGKKCACEKESGFDAMKRDQLLRNGF
ncbi:MAG: hypothetical protein R3192_17345 [Woeseiaceae bacterium]|nr:hypothetical protein [Woeseiaceae bacterium]